VPIDVQQQLYGLACTGVVIHEEDPLSQYSVLLRHSNENCSISEAKTHRRLWFTHKPGFKEAKLAGIKQIG